MIGDCKVSVENSHPSTDSSTAKAKPWGKVVNCYSAFDRFFPVCGLLDMTEGIYHGNPKTPYEQAETNQLDYLLDQVRCEPGRRVLDLGCGYGTLLERIRQRDAEGVGITIWFATTTIHFVRKPENPLDLLRNPFALRWGSDNFHVTPGAGPSK